MLFSMVDYGVWSLTKKSRVEGSGARGGKSVYGEPKPESGVGGGWGVGGGGGGGGGGGMETIASTSDEFALVHRVLAT